MRPTKTLSITTVLSLALLVDLPCSMGRVGGVFANPERDAEEIIGEQRFLTGMDMTWWFSEDGKMIGPGLTWGLILIPEKFEMELTLHSLLGGNVYSIPIDLFFKVPFRVGKRLVPYIGSGPMLIFDKKKGKTKHDYALTSAFGIAVNLPDYCWRIFLEGRYNFRFWQDYVHQGGVNLGFQYRF